MQRSPADLESYLKNLERQIASARAAKPRTMYCEIVRTDVISLASGNQIAGEGAGVNWFPSARYGDPLGLWIGVSDGTGYYFQPPISGIWKMNLRIHIEGSATAGTIIARAWRNGTTEIVLDQDAIAHTSPDIRASDTREMWLDAGDKIYIGASNTAAYNLKGSTDGSNSRFTARFIGS
jgi:hypothetical protein